MLGDGRVINGALDTPEKLGLKQGQIVKVVPKRREAEGCRQQAREATGVRQAHAREAGKIACVKNQQKRPSVSLEGSRSRFMCRTGETGSGSTHAISFGPGKLAHRPSAVPGPFPDSSARLP